MSIYISSFITVYICLITFVFGITIGSFVNCGALRVLKGEPVAHGRSHCISCGHTLGAADLVPLFSWLFLKGRCRYCGGKISAGYPLTELITGIAYVLIVLEYDLSLRALELAIMTAILLAVSLTDLDEMIIPDSFIIAGIAVRIVFILPEYMTGSDTLYAGADISLAGLYLRTLINGLSISLPVLITVLAMERILKKDVMGGGDIKLLFMTGLYFTWQVNMFSLFVSCIVGIAVGLLMIRFNDNGRKGKERITEAEDDIPEKAFPFGPAIAAGCFVGMLTGSQFADWYAGIF